jgi:hypothetical protein
MDTHCIATRKNGEPCKGTPLAGRPYCFSHDPDLAERRAEGRAQGGYGKSTSARARKHLRSASLEASDIHGLLSDALVKVSEGEMEPNVGTALASMAKALVSIHEATMLTERIEELERAAGITPANVTPMRRTA